MQNYHRHSVVSNIILADSVVFNEDYCKRAKELGHGIISSCEHGTQGNIFECYELAKKYGLKWRYVAEAYFVQDRNPELADNANCHIILAAKTDKGRGDLNEVLSEANISGYYHRPRVDMELLMRLDPRDVFVTTACLGGIWKYGYTENRETGEWSYDFTIPDRLVHQLHRHFGNSFMLEIQYHDVDKQKAVNRHILSLYRQLGIPLIVGLDSHFIYPEQAELRDARLEANGLHYENEDGFYMDYPPDDEVFRRFMVQGVFSEAQIREAMENTDIFLNFEDIELDMSRKLPTLYPNLSQQERNERYRQLVRDSWREARKEIPQERWPEYLEAIKYEVDTITQTDSLIERLYREKLVHGVGVSVDCPVNESEMELLKSIPTLVVHVIAGLVTDATLASLALNDLNLLVLGYKDYGRGVDYHARSPFIDQSIFVMKNGIESISKLFRHVSFDQLAVKQLGLRELVGSDTWDESYMGSDGEFTMYLDLVKNEYAVSSISPRHPLKDLNIRNTFASVREEAGFYRYFPPCKSKMKGY